MTMQWAAASYDAAELLTWVLVAVAVILGCARFFGLFLRKLGQPSVIGEVVAGIVLGPTILGAVPGDLTSTLFGEDVRPSLRLLGELGLVAFMFVVGLQLDLRRLPASRKLVAISASSVAVPFGLGVVAAGLLYEPHPGEGASVPFAPFALFVGAAMSITAFPVLARIIAEQQLRFTAIGALAIAIAAANDVVGWCLLALALAAFDSDSGLDVLLIPLELIVVVVTMDRLAGPALQHAIGDQLGPGRTTPGALAVILAGLAASAAITHRIGLEYVFGAFLFGAILRRHHGQELGDRLCERAQRIVALLAPIYFALPGFAVDLRSLGSTELPQLALVLVVACAGKFLGAAVSAYLTGLDWTEAGALGVLLNTRGLMELVAINIGLSAGLLTLQLYSLFLVMALTTTLMTTPMLHVFRRARGRPWDQHGLQGHIDTRTFKAT